MMKIELGKTYINGFGDEITIISMDGVEDLRFIGDEGGRFTKSGKWWPSASSDYDLIKEKELSK